MFMFVYGHHDKKCIFLLSSELVTKDMDINKHEKLSNITLTQTFKERNSVFIAIHSHNRVFNNE